MNAEEIARVAYQVERAYCIAIGENIPVWEERSNLYRLTATDAALLRLENPDEPVPDIDNKNGVFTDVQRTKWVICAAVIAALSHKWTGE